MLFSAEEHAFGDDPQAQSHAQGVLQTILTFLPLLIADLVPRCALQNLRVPSRHAINLAVVCPKLRKEKPAEGRHTRMGIDP